MRHRAVLFAVWLLAPALLCPQQAFSCGPYLEEAVFTGTMNPDAPLEEYIGGKIGIFQPTYARSYLFVAYRYLSGAGLDEEAQKAVLRLINARIGASYDLPGSAQLPEEGQAIREWMEARAQITSEGKAPDAMKEAGYFSYKNCLDDAFTAAARTLEEKIARFGAAGPEVAAWVKAQDRVFANCSGGEAIPEGPPAQTDSRSAADRAYQVAAAHFYAGNLDKAEEMFRAIADDPQSEWRQVAPYLAGRALLRKAMSDYVKEENEGAGNEEAKASVRQSFAAAEQQFTRVLASSELEAYHPSARRMLNLIRFRVNPDARRNELADSLLKNGPAKQLEQDLTDYIWLLDRLNTAFMGDTFSPPASTEDLSPDSRAETEKRAGAFIAALNGIDDLTDWIFTFQSQDRKAALEHALQRYGARGSLPWLAIALSRITPEHPGFPAIFDQASKIPESSPAYLFVGLHMVRCLMLAGKTEEARSRVDELLSSSAGRASRSTSNLLLALRMNLARNLDEFLKYAQRTPVRFLAGDDFPYAQLDMSIEPDSPEGKALLKELTSGKPLFDADAAIAFNETMPLNLWRQAIESQALPEHLRLMLARAGWVRAVLLNKDDAALALAALLHDRDPALKPFLPAFLGAKTPEARKSAAIYIILKNPGLKPYLAAGLGRLTDIGAINPYRDNWWCALSCSRITGEKCQSSDTFNYYAQGTALAPPTKAIYPGPKIAPPGFLSLADRKSGEDERRGLASLGPAPNYLSAYVVGCAKRKSADLDLPEALHLSVRSTRFGCTDGETTRHSKEAFEILHKKFPQSPWTKKTPYWF